MLNIFSIILSITLIKIIKTNGGIIITNITFIKPFCNAKDQILTLTLYCYNCDSSNSISSSTKIYFKDTNQNLIKCAFENSIVNQFPFKMNCTVIKTYDEESQVSFSSGDLVECDQDGNTIAEKTLIKILIKINENIESISSCNSPCVNANDVKDSKSCIDLKTSNKIYYPHCCFLKYQKNGKYKKGCVEISENEYKGIDDYIKELKSEICENEEEKENNDENNDENNNDQNNNDQNNNDQNNNNQNNKGKEDDTKNSNTDSNKKNKKKKCIIDNVNCNSLFLKENFILIFILIFIILF